MRNIKFILILSMYLIFLFLSNQSISLSQTPYNYGKMWKSWSSQVQIAYIKGFIDGVINGIYKYHIYEKYTNNEGKLPELPKKISEQLISMSELEGIHNVVSDLYKDPANSYIGLENIIYLARDKLRGKDIEKDLKLHRAAPYELQKQIIVESEE